MTSLTPEVIKEGPSFFSYSDDVVYHHTPLRHFTAAEQVPDMDDGVSCFCWSGLVAVLETKTRDSEVLHELYKLLRSTKQPIYCVEAYQDFVGIHNKKHLPRHTNSSQKRRRDWLMDSGLTFLDHDSITIDETVMIDEKVIIESQTHLRGKTRIDDGCCIGPGSFVENSEIGARCMVRFSVVSGSTVASEPCFGPYAHLRTNTQIGEGWVGNFVEIKNASLVKGTSAGHLSCPGDT